MRRILSRLVVIISIASGLQGLNDAYVCDLILEHLDELVEDDRYDRASSRADPVDPYRAVSTFAQVEEEQR